MLDLVDRLDGDLCSLQDCRAFNVEEQGSIESELCARSLKSGVVLMLAPGSDNRQIREPGSIANHRFRQPGGLCARSRLSLGDGEGT